MIIIPLRYLLLGIGIVMAIVITVLLTRWICRRRCRCERPEPEPEVCGFAYDPCQDIFYSVMDAWQRQFGYTRFYDEAMAPLGMIADAEPLRFRYGGKLWLLEFWKGQYGITTGAEIGVYTTPGPNRGENTFYGDTFDENHLDMEFTLLKNGVPMFSRRGTHWWLTGFRLGEYAETNELTMRVSVEAQSCYMREDMIESLIEAGYRRNELEINGNYVSFTYAAPRTAQPRTRTRLREWFVQWRNRRLVKLFNRLTGHLTTSEAKLNLLRTRSPRLYRHVTRLAQPTRRYRKFKRASR